jgi:hypothetical protein
LKLAIRTGARHAGVLAAVTLSVVLLAAFGKAHAQSNPLDVVHPGLALGMPLEAALALISPSATVERESVNNQVYFERIYSYAPIAARVMVKLGFQPEGGQNVLQYVYVSSLEEESKLRFSTFWNAEFKGRYRAPRAEVNSSSFPAYLYCLDTSGYAGAHISASGGYFSIHRNNSDATIKCQAFMAAGAQQPQKPLAAAVLLNRTETAPASAAPMPAQPSPPASTQPQPSPPTAAATGICAQLILPDWPKIRVCGPMENAPGFIATDAKSDRLLTFLPTWDEVTPDRMEGAILTAVMLFLVFLTALFALRFVVTLLMSKHPNKAAWSRRLTYAAVLLPLAPAVAWGVAFATPARFDMGVMTKYIDHGLPPSAAIVSSYATDSYATGVICHGMRIEVPPAEFVAFATSLLADGRFKLDTAGREFAAEDEFQFVHNVSPKDGASARVVSIDFTPEDREIRMSVCTVEDK